MNSISSGSTADFTVTLVELAATWWLQSTVLLIVGLAVAASLRRRGPAIQSVVYRVTLFAVLLCPLVTQALALSGVSPMTIDVGSHDMVESESTGPAEGQPGLYTDSTEVAVPTSMTHSQSAAPSLASDSPHEQFEAMKPGTAALREDRHDAGEKTILGETARFGADSFAKLLLNQDATSRRIAWRLCDLFMGEGVVGNETLGELAAGLRAHQLNIGWAIETMLRSELFFSDASIASRVSSPIEFVMHAVRALELLEVPPSTLVLAEWCSRLGQDLFYPPNVGGWKGGRRWLTSRTIVGRSNFAAALVAGDLRSPATPPELLKLAEQIRKESAINMRNGKLFETLLLGAPCSEPKRDTARWQPEDVAHLLSCPQAHLT